MAAQQQRVITADDLTDADEAILDELQAGARTKKYVVDATGLHRNTVGNRLDVLSAGDAVRCIHDTTALYELVSDPRDESAAEAAESTADSSSAPSGGLTPAEADTVCSALTAALRALEGQSPNPDTARAELERAQEVLDDAE